MSNAFKISAEGYLPLFDRLDIGRGDLLFTIFAIFRDRARRRYGFTSPISGYHPEMSWDYCGYCDFVAVLSDYQGIPIRL
jgi:hypothetical protein